MLETEPGSRHLEPSTSLVGREREIEEISVRLCDPKCRLLTLTGPGGIGKTRLALAVLTALRDEFSGRVYFVDLQAVDEPALLLSTIVNVLGLSLSGPRAPIVQVRQFLERRPTLLVLDNFEQLVESSALLGALLRGTQVHLLVTSREPTRIAEEWRLPINGLPLPKLGESPAGVREESPALLLFEARACRLEPDFRLADERDQVERICRLVDGMPLAIELAAAWVRTLSCREIADEISRNLGFLSTSLADLPERHRSVLAIFEQSWARLSPGERTVLCQLSVFRGGFSREAAHTVTGAGIEQLTTLVDRALLRRERMVSGTARYQIHELLRQFGEEKLEQDRVERDETRERHTRYFLQFLKDREADFMSGDRQREAMEEIDAELDNLRSAWRRAIQNGMFEAIESVSMMLANYFWFRGRFGEARERFQSGITAFLNHESSPARDRALAILYTALSLHQLHQDDGREARRSAQRALEIHREQSMAPVPGLDTDPRFVLCLNARWRGHFDEALELAQVALEESESRPHPQNRHFAHRLLADIYLDLGDKQLARHHGQIALELARENRDRWAMAYTHDILAAVAVSLHELDVADSHYRASLSTRRELGYWVGLADTLQKQGELSLLRGDLSQAEAQLLESLAHFQAIHMPAGEIESLAILARVYLELDNGAQAFQALADGLALTDPDTLSESAQSLFLFLVCAELLLELGEEQFAVDLLDGIEPAIFRASDREQVQNLLSSTNLAPSKPPKSLHSLYVALKRFFAQSPLPEAPESGDGPSANDALVEPLTARELEVLHHIAAGLSNQQIADELIISLGTVKSYSSHIYAKLGVSRRTEAVVQAREMGLIP